MLEVKGLSKSFGNENVINDISFTVERGSVVGIIGKNGAGKSTLISIISTVIEKFQGEIRLDGKNINNNLKEYREILGYVPQEALVYEELTVKENIVFWNMNKSKELVNKIINVLELEPWMKKKAKTLSGGTKNRLNIAIGIINNPKIIVLDEPLVGISLTIKRNFFKLLKEFADEGNIILISSHEVLEMDDLCTDLLILESGKLICYEKIHKIKKKCEEENINLWDYVCDLGGL